MVLPSRSVMDMAASTCRHRSCKKTIKLTGLPAWGQQESGMLAPPEDSLGAKPKQMGCIGVGLSPGGGSLLFILFIRYKRTCYLENSMGRGNYVFQTMGLRPLALVRLEAPPTAPKSTSWSAHLVIYVYLCGCGCIPASCRHFRTRVVSPLVPWAAFSARPTP